MSVIKKRQGNVTWEEGSGNVFADLDMPDAEEKLAKAKLALKINEIIKERGLKQIEAAALLGVNQSKISLLHCGQLTDFSIERLARFLTLLNQDVNIVVKQAKKTKKIVHQNCRCPCHQGCHKPAHQGSLSVTYA